MDTLAEIRSLRQDVIALGDHGTAALLDKALQHLSAWRFEQGYIWLERALDQHQRFEATAPPADGVGKYFAACALAVA
jgi:hypothetical protein